MGQANTENRTIRLLDQALSAKPTFEALRDFVAGEPEIFLTGRPDQAVTTEEMVAIAGVVRTADQKTRAALIRFVEEEKRKEF